jgi:outer membrane protein assembly factor BamB
MNPVHITAVCPDCQTSYQVSPTLRGKQIRCPNSTCRKIFTVGGEERPPEPPPLPEPDPAEREPEEPKAENGQWAGSANDLIPVLPADEAVPLPAAEPAPDHVSSMVPLVEAEMVVEEAEPVAEPPAAEPPLPVEAPYWLQPPPVRRPGEAVITEPSADDGSGTPTRLMPEPLPAGVEGQPRELPPGAWETPPVQRPGGGDSWPAAAEEGLPGLPAAGPDEAHEAQADELHTPRVSKKHSLLVSALMLLVVFGGLGLGTLFVVKAFWQTEADRARLADEAYRADKFRDAQERYHQLGETYPTSEQAPRYRFLEQLSALRAGMADQGIPTDATLDQVDQFIAEHKQDPQLKEHARDLGASLVKLIDEYVKIADPETRQPLAVMKRAREVLAHVEEIDPEKEAVTRAEKTKIGSDFASLAQNVARAEHRQQVVQEIQKLARHPSAETIKNVRNLLKREEAGNPEIASRPEVVGAMRTLYAGHLDSVKYDPGPVKKETAGPREEVRPSIVFDPRVPGLPVGDPSDDQVVLALARGVLYALDAGNGRVKWATRVGIDTNTLPTRVPARDPLPERILVLSADTRTLTALTTDGVPLWKYQLSDPCLGRPLVVDQRAYLPTYDGLVHEIELAEGHLLGRYNLHQHLTMGGAREGKSKRLYFPADDFCVYVLDVEQHRCEAILYTGHPANSIKSEPIVVPPGPDDAPGFLVLNQAQGFNAMELRVWSLPLKDRNQAQLPLNPPPRLSGSTWFPPFSDGEKVVMLSDTGVLGLFGIRQVHNLDEPLFPLLAPGGLPLDPFLDPEMKARGRSEVVRVRGSDIWVLASGQLQRLELAWSQAVGPKPVARWREPLELGSPLHASQVIRDPRTGRTTLVLVTQPLDRQSCLATAVDAETGEVLWQRQLGMVCQGEPLALRPDDKSGPVLVGLDQGGSLFTLDPTLFPRAAGAQWQSGGDKVYLAGPVAENPAMPPQLIPGPDGRSAYEVAASGTGGQTVVRRAYFREGERRPRVEEWKVELPAAPAGTPAVAGGQLVLPVADGNLYRLSLPSGKPAGLRGGPVWRAARADAQARGHVVAIGGDRFLMTDGLGGLLCYDWPQDRPADFTEAGPPMDPPLPSRVVSAPLLLPRKAGEPPLVYVADSGGGLTLVAVEATGQPKARRRLSLGGRVTSGPFLAPSEDGGVRVGCVVDRRRLVWLDPSQPGQPLWQYDRQGDALVGRPQRAGDLLVVAHQSGRAVGLDPATGQPRGPGYALQGSVAFAATPVAFGPDRLLAPLSDGTALLLALKDLSPAAK